MATGKHPESAVVKAKLWGIMKIPNNGHGRTWNRYVLTQNCSPVEAVQATFKNWTGLVKHAGLPFGKRRANFIAVDSFE
jgi:hypothetical protein